MRSPETLASLQALLGAAFRHDHPLSDHPEASRIASLITPSRRMSALARAEIYREQFWLRHLESLREDLPALEHLIGAEALEAFLRAYLSAHPPRSFSLRDLGDRLCAFAEDYQELPADIAAVARETLRFELACLEAFDGEGASPLALDAALAVPAARWLEVRLSFLPTLKLMRFAHPVNELRARIKRGERPERSLPPRPTRVALWRCPVASEVRHRPLSEGEHALLRSLKAGASLGEACLALAGDIADLAPELERWFRGWARRGWIAAIDVPPT